MIRYDALVFDEYIPSSAPVFTGVQHMRVLGLGDQIGLHAILDEAAAACSLTVAIEHSTDGVNWSPKHGLPEILAASVGTRDITSVYGGEAFPAPQSLEFVRLRITITNGRGVHLRLYAAVRDRAKGGFAICDCVTSEDVEPRPQSPRAASPEEELAALLSIRPQQALFELRQKLDEAPTGASLPERLSLALASMGERERIEIAHFLASVDRMSPEGRLEILRRGRIHED